MVTPEIIGRDSDDGHPGDKGQSADMMDPGPTMNAPREAHIVGMVVEDDNLEWFHEAQPLDQQITDVMKIPASQKGQSGLGVRLGIQGGFEAFQIGERATVTDHLLPVVERNGPDAGKRQNGSIKIEDERLFHFHSDGIAARRFVAYPN